MKRRALARLGRESEEQIRADVAAGSPAAAEHGFEAKAHKLDEIDPDIARRCGIRSDHIAEATAIRRKRAN